MSNSFFSIRFLFFSLLFLFLLICYVLLYSTELEMNWSNNLSKKVRNSYNAMKRLLREINI
jgi:hypothetical protein